MNYTSHESSFFQGAGYLLGFLIAVILGFIIFLISGHFGIAIPATVPIGVTLGIAFKQRFQGKVETYNPQKIKILIGLFTVGVLLFISLYFITRFI